MNYQYRYHVLRYQPDRLPPEGSRELWKCTDHLSRLLKDGWEPVREVPFSNSAEGLVLILLRKPKE